MQIELDCARMTSRGAAHDYLQEKFCFPDYYGRNLDALYDLLTSRGEIVTIVLVNSCKAEENLGGYGAALISTIREAAEENPNMELIEE